MAHRSRPDPLQSLRQPTWLVVRNSCNQPLEWLEIAPGVDLRAFLTRIRLTHCAGGWVCEDIGRVCGFFFAQREGERIMVGIERYRPDKPAPTHSDAGHHQG